MFPLINLSPPKLPPSRSSSSSSSRRPPPPSSSSSSSAAATDTSTSVKAASANSAVPFKRAPSPGHVEPAGKRMGKRGKSPAATSSGKSTAAPTNVDDSESVAPSEMFGLPADLYKSVMAYIAFFASAAACYKTEKPVVPLTGAAHEALVLRVSAPDPSKMIPDLLKAHDKQVDICEKKKLQACSGPCAVKFFRDRRPADIILLKDIPTADYSFILTLMYLMHFATAVAMWMEYGGGKTGRTFVSFIAFLYPIVAHVLCLLGREYSYVIVKDLAECWDQPYASKEKGPLSSDYKFFPLVQPSIDAIFDMITFLPRWGMSFILGSYSLEPYLPEKALAGTVMNLATSTSHGYFLCQHPGGQVMGTAPHFSLPPSSSGVLDYTKQTAAALGVDKGELCAPVLQALADPAMISATDAAIDGVDSSVVEAMRDGHSRDRIVKLIEQELGTTAGSMALAALTASASRRYVTYQCFSESAVKKGFQDVQQVLYNAIIKEEDKALEVELRDAREDTGKTLRDILSVIKSGKGHTTAKRHLEALARSFRDVAGGAKPDDNTPKEPYTAQLNSILSAVALHVECSFGGKVGGKEAAARMLAYLKLTEFRLRDMSVSDRAAFNAQMTAAREEMAQDHGPGVTPSGAYLSKHPGGMAFTSQQVLDIVEASEPKLTVEQVRTRISAHDGTMFGGKESAKGATAAAEAVGVKDGATARFGRVKKHGEDEDRIPAEIASEAHKIRSEGGEYGGGKG